MTGSEYAPHFCTDYSLVGTSLCGPYSVISICFAITVTVLLCAEMILGSIEGFVHNTQYESVKNKVFQEMTGIGFLSFLTIVFDAVSNGAATIPEEYLHDLHHADFVIFIMSSLYLAQVSTHMYLSSHQWKKWKIAANAQVGELVANFNNNDSSLYWWFTSNEVRDQMEYKILLSLFCKKFNIRKTDFNFPGYLNECFRHYIISLIENSYLVRIMFGSLLALNLIRINFFNASATHDHCDEHCKANHLLLFFVACGWAMTIACLVLVVVSRMYEFRLLCCVGISKVSDYAKYLMDEEQSDINKANRLFNRQSSVTLTKNDLKTTLDALRQAKEDEEAEEEQSSLMHRLRHYLLLIYVNIVQYLGLKVNRNRLDSKELAEMGIDEDSSDDSDEDKVIEETEADVKKRAKKLLNAQNDEPTQGPKQNRMIKSMSFATMLSLKGAIKQTAGHHSGPDSDRITDRKRSATTRRREQTGNHDQEHSHHDHDAHHRRKMSMANSSSLQAAAGSGDMSDIFLFSLPGPYFFTVQVLMFLHGTYFSFYLTNFLILPSYVDEQYRAMWHILMIIPIIVIIPLMRYIVKVSSVVKALAHIRQDSVAKVMEDDDAAEKACQYLRLKLVNRLAVVTNNSENSDEIKEIFTALVDECDHEHKGYISRAGFRYLLRKLHLHFTDQRFKEVMDVIDSNFDNQLSAEELYRFTYPDQAAKEALQQRIRDQAINVANSSLIVPNKKRDATRSQGSLMASSLKYLMSSFSNSAKVAVSNDNDNADPIGSREKYTDDSNLETAPISTKTMAKLQQSPPDFVDDEKRSDDERPLRKSANGTSKAISSSKLTDEQLKLLSAAAVATSKLGSPDAGSRKQLPPSTKATSTPGTSTPTVVVRKTVMEERLSAALEAEAVHEKALNSARSGENSMVTPASIVFGATTANVSQVPSAPIVLSPIQPKRVRVAGDFLDDNQPLHNQAISELTASITSTAETAGSGSFFNDSAQVRNRALSEVAPSTTNMSDLNGNSTTSRAGRSYSVGDKVALGSINSNIDEDVQVFEVVDN